MNEALLQIANGFKMIAAGYEAMAAIGKTDIEAAKVDEAKNSKKEKKNNPTELEEKVTVEDVRSVLAVKTRDGKTQQVKALLNQFGAEKLSSVPEDKLADLKAKAEVL